MKKYGNLIEKKSTTIILSLGIFIEVLIFIKICEFVSNKL